MTTPPESKSPPRLQSGGSGGHATNGRQDHGGQHSSFGGNGTDAPDGPPSGVEATGIGPGDVCSREVGTTVGESAVVLQDGDGQNQEFAAPMSPPCSTEVVGPVGSRRESTFPIATAEDAEETVAASDSVETPELPLDHKLQMISDCLAYGTYEANVYWQRNAIYLAINGLLVGAVVTVFDRLSPLMIASVSLFGVYLNWYWPHVNQYSKALAEKWRADARAIASSTPEIAVHMKALVRQPRVTPPGGKRPSAVMNELSASFRLIWTGGVALGAVLWLLDLLS